MSQTTLFTECLTVLCWCKWALFFFHSTVSHASLGLVWDSNPDVLKGPALHTPVPGKCHSTPQMEGLLPVTHWHELGGLSRSANSCTSLVLSWDLNPNVLKGPTLCVLVPGKCHSTPLTNGLWLVSTGRVSCPLNGYIPSSHSTRERESLSPTADCASELVTEPGASSLPPQVRELGSQPQSKESPTVRDWLFLRPQSMVFLLFKYSPALPQPLFFFPLSAEGDLSPPCLHCTFYLSQFAITHVWPARLSPWTCLCHSTAQTLGIQRPLPSTLLCLRGNFRFPYFSAMLDIPLYYILSINSFSD